MNLKNFVTYRATPGLERYLEHERFAVWRGVHQQLMKKDYSYARQHQAYLASVARASVLVPVAAVPLGLGVADTIAARFLHWPVSYGIYGAAAGVVCTLAAVAYTARLAFRQQVYMNQHVAVVLQARATA